MMKRKVLFPLVIMVISGWAAQAQVTSGLGDLLGGIQKSGRTLGNDDIVKGLKEALIVGVGNGSAEASKVDGYFKNELIKIVLPPEATKVGETLRKMGMGAEVDKFTLALNRAAEGAAKKSKPIFVKAVTSMTIPDALDILKGSDDAATSYLKKTTNQQLYDTFFPVVDSTLNKTQATKYYADLVKTYNQIPLVKKVNPDLKKYATQKTIDGLYILIALEEKKIREDPVARVSDLLKKVFSQSGK